MSTTETNTADTGDPDATEPRPGDGPRNLFRALSPGTVALGAVIGFVLSLVRPRSWK